jgi:hypothetical protein
MEGMEGMEGMGGMGGEGPQAPENDAASDGAAGDDGPVLDAEFEEVDPDKKTD